MDYKLLLQEIRLIVPIKNVPITLEEYKHYRISYWGGIIFNTKTGNILNCWRNENGYRRARLCSGKNKTFMYVHRLVALAFIPNYDPINKSEVNHIDAVRHNCDAPNLEWMTRKENMEYKYNRHKKKFDEIELYPVEEKTRIETPTVGVDEDLPF